MRSTFELKRVIDPKVHILHDKENQYDRHVARIERIIARKPRQDTSTAYYMRLLNKTHHVARSYNTNFQHSIIERQNSVLLKKIVHIKGRIDSKNNFGSFSVPFFQKRQKQQKRILQENQSILSRVIKQQAAIDDKAPKIHRPSKHIPKIKKKKLPKLMSFKE